MKLVAGQSLRYRFKASVPLASISTITAATTCSTSVRKAAVAARTGRFRAKSAETYLLDTGKPGKSVAVIEGVVENAAAR